MRDPSDPIRAFRLPLYETDEEDGLVLDAQKHGHQVTKQMVFCSPAVKSYKSIPPDGVLPIFKHAGKVKVIGKQISKLCLYVPGTRALLDEALKAFEEKAVALPGPKGKQMLMLASTQQQFVAYNKNLLVFVVVDIITFGKYFLLFKRTVRQEDKRTGEIPNIAYTIVLDELWYFSCPSCPQGREIASDHIKSSVKKSLGNRVYLWCPERMRTHRTQRIQSIKCFQMNFGISPVRRVYRVGKSHRTT